MTQATLTPPWPYITIRIQKHPQLEQNPIDEFDLSEWLKSMVKEQAVLLTQQGDNWACHWQSQIEVNPTSALDVDNLMQQICDAHDQLLAHEGEHDDLGDALLSLRVSIRSLQQYLSRIERRARATAFQRI